MVRPEDKITKIRLIVAVSLLGGLVACSGSGSSVDCETNPDNASCEVGVLGASGEGPESTSSGDSAQTESTLPLAQCISENSDIDGDGYGYENGASCIATVVPGDTPIPISDTVSVADVNHVIVVTGQSNVEAPLTAFDPELDAPHPRVFAYTDSGWQIADLHQVWDENAHPGNHSLTDPTSSPNNNFTFHFGKTLAQLKPDAVPAFIVLAAPGEGIANWDYDSPFYLKMRTKITTALSQLPNHDVIDVMLWHQGESDWLYEGTSDVDATGFTDKDSYEYTNYYEIKLRNVIANFRSETWSETDMPFICGELRIADGVSRHLLALNDNGDPNSGCVGSADLPYRLSDPSGAHYSAAGLRELGRRYMQMYLSIIGG